MPLTAPEPLVCIHERQVLRWADNTPRCFPLHFIILILRARGRYRNAGIDLPLDRPVISLIPAGDEDHNQVDGMIESWFIGFRWPGMQLSSADGSQADSRVRLGWDEGQVVVPRCFQPQPSDVTTLCATFAAMQEAFAHGAAGASLGARGLALTLVEHYILAAGRCQTAEPEIHLRQLIEDPANDDVRLDDLMARCALGVDAVRSRFRARFGLTPVAWRLHRRLDRARELLSRPEATVAAAASAAGFSDPAYFTRCFHRQFGIVPRDLVRR